MIIGDEVITVLISTGEGEGQMGTNLKKAGDKWTVERENRWGGYSRLFFMAEHTTWAVYGF